MEIGPSDVVKSATMFLFTLNIFWKDKAINPQYFGSACFLANDDRYGTIYFTISRQLWCNSIRYNDVNGLQLLTGKGQPYDIAPIKREFYVTCNNNFRQICFADFVNSYQPCLSLCLYVCMCVLPICENVCSQVAKILNKITYKETQISSRMAQVTFFSSLTLTFIFKVSLLAAYLIS